VTSGAKLTRLRVAKERPLMDLKRGSTVKMGERKLEATATVRSKRTLVQLAETGRPGLAVDRIRETTFRTAIHMLLLSD
jgi:hypothetical protein